MICIFASEVWFRETLNRVFGTCVPPETLVPQQHQDFTAEAASALCASKSVGLTPATTYASGVRSHALSAA